MEERELNNELKPALTEEEQELKNKYAKICDDIIEVVIKNDLNLKEFQHFVNEVADFVDEKILKLKVKEVFDLSNKK